MELHEARYFQALCRTRNFTRAAQQCNVTQPALTRAIRKLEEELGGLLFSRERNNTHLTELGRLLEPQFAAMIDGADTARRTADRFLRLQGAQMTLGVMCTIGPLRFVGFLDRFRAAYPGVDLTLLEAMPARLAEMLATGEIDVAIMAQPDGFEAPLTAHALYRERFVVACSLNHRFARRPSVPMVEMDGETYLRRINCEYRDFLAERLAELGAAVTRAFQSEREDWIQIMAAAGLGVCFLPEFTAIVPGLVTRPVTAPGVEREVCMVTVAGRRWSPPVAAFVSTMTGYAWNPVAGIPGLLALPGMVPAAAAPA